MLFYFYYWYIIINKIFIIFHIICIDNIQIYTRFRFYFGIICIPISKKNITFYIIFCNYCKCNLCNDGANWNIFFFSFFVMECTCFILLSFSIKHNTSFFFHFMKMRFAFHYRNIWILFGIMQIFLFIFVIISIIASFSFNFSST